MMRALMLGVTLTLAAGMARAANFDDLLSGVAQGAAEAYAQPLADAGTLLAGAGTFHSARSKGIAGLDAGIKLLMVPVSSGDPAAGSILDQTEASALGLPVLVANKGLVKGLQVGARFMSLELSKDVGQLDLVGASLRFELNELFHVPLLMPRIGLQADYTRLAVGESVTTTVTGLDLIVSKSFVILEPYAGLSLLKGSTDLGYTHRPAVGDPVSVSATLDSDATRLAAGLNFTPFPLLRVNAEYALADYSTITVGLLFNLF